MPGYCCPISLTVPRVPVVTSEGTICNFIHVARRILNKEMKDPITNGVIEALTYIRSPNNLINKEPTLSDEEKNEIVAVYAQLKREMNLPIYGIRTIEGIDALLRLNDEKKTPPILLAILKRDLAQLSIILDEKEVDPSLMWYMPSIGKHVTPLILAIEMGYVELVEKLLNDKRVNDKNFHESFRSAVHAGHFFLLEPLLKGKSAGYYTSALYIAAEEGALPAVELLLKNPEVNPNYEQRTYSKYTDHSPILTSPLDIAAKNGHAAVVKLLLNDERISLVNISKTFRDAAQNGHESVMKHFLDDNRIDPNSSNVSYIDPPFMAAVKNGQTSIVKLFLNSDRINLHKHYSSALHSAVSRGFAPVVKLLVEDTRVDPNEPIGFKHETALRNAVRNQHTSVVTLLLDNDRINVAKEAPELVYLAAEEGFLSILKILLSDKRINPSEAVTIDGKTALYIAAENNHSNIVQELLLDRRIDPNQARVNGVTPLFIAVQKAYPKVVNLLLSDERVKPDLSPRVIPKRVDENGAIRSGGNDEIRFAIMDEDVNGSLDKSFVASTTWPSQTSGGVTPLYIAGQQGFEAIVKVLLADPRVDSKRALYTAALFNQGKALNLLGHGQNITTIKKIDYLRLIKTLLSEEGFRDHILRQMIGDSTMMNFILTHNTIFLMELTQYQSELWRSLKKMFVTLDTGVKNILLNAILKPQGSVRHPLYTLYQPQWTFSLSSLFASKEKTILDEIKAYAEQVSIIDEHADTAETTRLLNKKVV